MRVYLQGLSPVPLEVGGSVGQALTGLALTICAVFLLTLVFRRIFRVGNYYKRGFYQEAGKIGLHKKETALLEWLIITHDIEYPFGVLREPTRVAEHLKKIMRILEVRDLSEEEMVEEKLRLYQIREILERVDLFVSVIGSTKRLVPQERVRVKYGDGAYTPTIVTDVLFWGFGIMAVEKEREEGNHPPKGTPVELQAWDPRGEMYNFTTKVKGFKNLRGKDSVVLRHKKRNLRGYTRIHRREEVNIPCSYHIQESPRKDLEFAKTKFRGITMDLTIGGCAISTDVPVDMDTHLSLAFELPSGETVQIEGIVRGLRQIKNSDSSRGEEGFFFIEQMDFIVNIMFTDVKDIKDKLKLYRLLYGF